VAISQVAALFAAAVIAGCTATSGPASPTSVASASPTATLASPASSISPASSPAAFPPTLTIERGVDADGPGESVSEALAHGGSPQDLVNGTILRDADGRVWLCEALVNLSPPACAEPRLLVLNMPPEDMTFQDPGVHVADGVSWADRVQLFGFVRAP
jgi:ABC-type transport system substrate-binding protein